MNSRASDGSNNLVGDEITVKDTTRNVTAKAGSKTPYPAELPVPQYPGSEMVVTAADTSVNASSKSMAMLKTMDASEKIMALYKEKLASAGWTIDNSMEGQMSFISAKKGSGTMNISIISGGNEGTTISVSLQ